MQIMQQCYTGQNNEIASAHGSSWDDIPRISWAKDGFWIDQDHKFTTDEDEYLFWIPPSQIAFVMNLEDTEG